VRALLKQNADSSHDLQKKQKTKKTYTVPFQIPSRPVLRPQC